MFYSSTNLTSIQVDGANPYFSSVDGALLNKSQTVLHTFPSGKTPGTYTIPATVTNIQLASFYFCPGVTNILVPASVLRIAARVVSMVAKG